MLNLSWKAAQAGFFDRDRVLRSVDAATRKVLSRFGAFVRTRARTSIRKRKGVSPPAGPPYSHTGLLRTFLFFSYDADRHSVVVGPTLIGRPTGAPEALEYGGTVAAPAYWRRTRPTAPGRLAIRARPFMGPALAAELPGLPAMWRDSVK